MGTPRRPGYYPDVKDQDEFLEFTLKEYQGCNESCMLELAMNCCLSVVGALGWMHIKPEDDEGGRNLYAYGTVLHRPEKVSEVASRIFTVEQCEILHQHLWEDRHYSPCVAVVAVMLESHIKRERKAA